jgi:hypothetical protein
MVWALLLKGVLSFEFLFLFVVLLVVLLIAFEDFGIVGHVLLVGRPILLPFLVRVLRVLHVEVDRAHIIVVDSVLNVVEIVVGSWHTDRCKLLHKSVLEVLSLILD